MKNSAKNTEKISTVDLFSAGHDAFSWLIRDLGMQEAIRSVETASILFGDAVACDLLWSVVRGNRKQPSSTKLTAKDIRCKDDVLQKLAICVKNRGTPSKIMDLKARADTAIELWDTTEINNEHLQDKLFKQWMIENIEQKRTSLQYANIASLFPSDYVNCLSNPMFNHVNYKNLAIKEMIEFYNSTKKNTVKRKRKAPINFIGNTEYKLHEFCSLFIYAYLGVTLDQKTWGEFINAHDEDIKPTSESLEEYIEIMFVRTEQSIASLYGKYPPKVLSHALKAAKCRNDIDKGFDVSPESLARLSGVDRKTVINSQLSPRGEGIHPYAALEFLNQKSRNRWIEKDDNDLPMGVKYFETFYTDKDSQTAEPLKTLLQTKKNYFPFQR